MTISNRIPSNYYIKVTVVVDRPTDLNYITSLAGGDSTIGGKMYTPWLASLLCTASTILAQSGSNILSFVDPLIGTVNGGHVFPGATLPFAMAKAGADVNGEDQGGFASDNSNITGFSHMHDSGTGGVTQTSHGT